MKYVKQVFKMKIVLITVLGLLIAGLGLAGCGASQPAVEPTSAPAAEVVVGLALSTLDNPFFVSLKEGAEEAAKRTDVKLVVQDAKDDAARQASQVQAMIDDGVSALLINPVDGDAIVATIEAANAANIPVFTIDRGAAGGKIISHIASDNVAGGQMAGDYLAELLTKKGKVVELEGSVGTSAARDRGAGFNEAMAEYADIEIVARETANFNQADGKTVFAQILANQPEINGVFAHNDGMILGAIEAAKEAGRADDILFVGFDAVDDAITALESGDLAATIAQQPAEIGRLGVEAASKHLNGESLPDVIAVDLALVAE